MTRPLARRALLALLGGAALAVTVPSPAAAQGGWLVQGVADTELWKTDSASALLSRNGGRAGVMQRVDLWAAAEPVRDVILFGELMGEAGSGRHEPGNEIYLQQLGVRWTPSDAFTIEAGRFNHVVGVFATRRLSFRNPLVGEPDGYANVYPSGVVVSGTLDRVDYRAGMLSLPLTREGYVPESGARYRPALGLGITPAIGVRFGASASAGPYLGDEVPSTALAGREWTAYRQRLVALDAQVSHGWLELNAEAMRGSYDVPRGGAVVGYSGYLEAKYTLAPRVFVAARAERNDYPYIAPLPNGSWIAVNAAFSDVELGGAYRLGPSTLLKLSGRTDRWTPSPNPGSPQANGYALALQLSQQFDVLDMLKSVSGER